MRISALFFIKNILFFVFLVGCTAPHEPTRLSQNSKALHVDNPKIIWESDEKVPCKTLQHLAHIIPFERSYLPREVVLRYPNREVIKIFIIYNPSTGACYQSITNEENRFVFDKKYSY